MAWTITLEPHNLGDLKMVRVIATNDGALSGQDTTALTVTNMGLSKLFAFINEANPSADNTAVTKLRMLYNGSSALTYWSGTGNTAVSSNQDVGSGYVVRALAIGV